MMDQKTNPAESQSIQKLRESAPSAGYAAWYHLAQASYTGENAPKDLEEAAFWHCRQPASRENGSSRAVN